MLLEPEGCPLRALVYAVAGIRYGGVAGMTIKTIEDPVHHDYLAVGSSFIYGLPAELLQHGGDAVSATVVRLDKSRCTSLDHVDLGGQ